MAQVAVLLALIVLGTGLVSEGASSRRHDVVNVGAICSLSTTDGRIANFAMKAAENDVNSDPSFLGGSKLNITLHNGKTSGFLSLMGALQFMETDTVAIIGPQTSTMAHVLSHLSNELHVPLLSFMALDPSLSPLQYPFFVQTAPSDLFLMRAIAEMVSFYGWSDVIAVHTDDEGSRNGITTLGDELEERRSKISYKAVLPIDLTHSGSRIRDELGKIQRMESRIIVVNTFPRTGALIFEEAQRLGMIEKGYVWIATTWLSALLDASWPLPTETAKSLRGVLTLRLHTPDSRKKRDFMARWNKLSNGSVGFNVNALYAYDTVWIVAQAIKTLLDSGGNISFSNDTNLMKLEGGALNLAALSIFDQGSQLLKNVLKTKMSGLTGQIQFNSDRSMLQPSYDIINVLDDGFREIGYWSNHSGLSVVPPEPFYHSPPNRSSSNQHLNNVTWPGGTSVTPRGWVFPNNGRKLRIGVPNRASFKDFVQRINGSSNKVQGYCIEIFERAVKLLPYAAPHEFILFGDGIKNPNYNELVNKITTGVFDAVVGDVAIVTKRTRVVDFTQPYIESGLVVIAPVTKLNRNAWAFLRPFTPQMWAVTAAFFIIVGVVIWILEHRINDEFRGPPRRQIMTILWFSFSTMFFSHRENTVSTLGRMVLLIWLFVVLIITSSYTASLTSILTVQQLISPIKGVDTLISSTGRIGFQIGSFAENYMVDELNIAKSRLIPLSSPEEFAAALENGTVSAIVDERPYVDLFLSDYCNFAIRGQEFTRSGWGFAFPRDSPLAVDLSTAILSLSESGQLQKIHDKWLSKSNCSDPQDSQLANSEQLNLHSFWGLFLVCGIVCSIALFIYFGKIVHDFCQHVPEESIDSARTSPSKTLQTFLAFVDEKEEEVKRRVKRKRDDTCSNDHDVSRNRSERIGVVQTPLQC